MSDEDSTFARFRDKLGKTTISEKLDYKTLLIHALRTVETSILSGDDYIIESSIWTLYNLMPESWHDKQFKNKIKECSIEEEIDIRPIVAGNIRMSAEICKQIGVPPFRTETRTDHYKMLSACVNLMERLGVLMRRTPKAWIGGRSGVAPDAEESVH